MDENLWSLSVAATAGLAVVLALFGSLLLAGLMLGTAVVLRIVQYARHKVTDDQLREIEDYANRKDGEGA